MAGTAVAEKKNAEVAEFDDDFMREAAELGGAGRTKSMDDNIVPRLSLLQDNSPESKKRDPEYVDGAEPGMILNKATRALYNEIEVVPWATDRAILQWTPRDAGGGLRGRHPMVGTAEQSTLKAGGTARPDPKDPKKTIWLLPNGDELIDTRDVYVMIVEREGGIGSGGAILKASPAVVSFSSTGHTVAKAWSTMRNASLLPNGSEHPIWFKSYRMKTKPAKNNKGDFFVLAFDDLGDKAGWVKEAKVRAQCKNLSEQFDAGKVRAADDDDHGSGGGGGQDLSDEI